MFELLPAGAVTGNNQSDGKAILGKLAARLDHDSNPFGFYAGAHHGGSHDNRLVVNRPSAAESFSPVAGKPKQPRMNARTDIAESILRDEPFEIGKISLFVGENMIGRLENFSVEEIAREGF